MVTEIVPREKKITCGTTESGFQYSIDQEVMDDYELLEDLCEVDNGNAGKITTAARRILGDDQLKALKEHLRNEKGRVPASKMIEEISQIFKDQSVKNS